jgi:YVTN family beta-propeller protein
MSLFKRLSLKLFTLSLLIAAIGFTPLHAQTVGYVLGFNGVTVLNIPANTTLTTIPTNPAVFQLDQAIIASPDGTRVYALYENPGTVLVIDTATNTAVTSILVGAAPTARELIWPTSRLL